MRALINIVFALVAAARLFIVVLTSSAHPHHTAVISLIRETEYDGNTEGGECGEYTLH